jgi:hypothetical protein
MMPLVLLPIGLVAAIPAAVLFLAWDAWMMRRL